MKLQPALRKPLLHRSPHPPGLLLTPAVDNNIVRITFKGNARVIPPHPLIKRIMQEEIGQQRTDHSPLWRPLTSLHKRAIPQLSRSSEPSLNIEMDPLAVRMFPQGSHQQIMIQVIKEPFNVNVQNPIVVPTSLPGHSDRLNR
jgi:hypothetical protein